MLALAVCGLSGSDYGRVLYGEPSDPIPWGWPSIRAAGLEGPLEPDVNFREPNAVYLRQGQRRFKVIIRADVPVGRVLELESEAPAAAPQPMVGWRKGSAMHPPKPPPVMGEYDPLRGQEVDAAATRDAEQRTIDNARRIGVVEPSQAQVRERQLRFLQWAAPEQFQAIVEKTPTDPLVLAVLAERPQQAQVQAPAATSPQVPAPAPAEPPAGEDLDQLLLFEEQAEAAGDADALAEIRSKIERAMKQ